MSDHAVVVYMPLQDGDMDTLFDLEDALMEALDESGAGEFDGNELGAGEAVLYMYGPDADKLFSAVEKVLRGSAVAREGYAVKRYGAPTDNVREVRVDLG